MPLQAKSPLEDDQSYPTPLVYVTENPTWEYKVMDRALDDLPDSDELNGLGRDGWELATTISTSDQVIFYFKRLGK